MSRLWRWGSVLALLTLGAAMWLGASSAAAGATTVKSTVTITSGEGTQFTGKIASAKKQCRAGRTVKLYVEPPYMGRGDTLAGTARSDSAGIWTMEGSFAAAVYYAVVTATLIHINGVPYRCAADYSLRMHY